MAAYAPLPCRADAHGINTRARHISERTTVACGLAVEHARIKLLVWDQCHPFGAAYSISRLVVLLLCAPGGGMDMLSKADSLPPLAELWDVFQGSVVMDVAGAEDDFLEPAAKAARQTEADAFFEQCFPWCASSYCVEKRAAHVVTRAAP